ncbi:class II glutamine amidotransferase [Cellulomonas sp. P5_C5]
MCRWLAYTGSPVLIDDLLYKPTNSLVVQSLHSRLGAEATNGDGVGVGWYTEHSPTPGVFRSIEPAWSDRNLRELAEHVRSGMVLAHIRATSGSAVQQTNCHPFRHGRWLWMHNGLLAGFAAMKRDLVLAVDPDLFPFIEGSTDSEVLFYLALTFGLEDDPPAAVARAVGLVEEVGRAHGVAFPVQMTVCTTDGQRLWAFRYSTEGQSRSLFHNADVAVLKEQYPENPVLHDLSDQTRIVVSEPLGDLKGAWHEVPESSCLLIDAGREELTAFQPTSPAH